MNFRFGPFFGLVCRGPEFNETLDSENWNVSQAPLPPYRCGHCWNSFRNCLKYVQSDSVLSRLLPNSCFLNPCFSWGNKTNEKMFPKSRFPMGETHELFVLALSLVWFDGATPDCYSWGNTKTTTKCSQNPCLPEGPARHLDASRQNLTPHCLAAIFDSQLPSPKLSLKMPPKLRLPHNRRGQFFLFQNSETISTTPTPHISKKYALKICHKMRSRVA